MGVHASTHGQQLAVASCALHCVGLGRTGPIIVLRCCADRDSWQLFGLQDPPSCCLRLQACAKQRYETANEVHMPAT